MPRLLLDGERVRGMLIDPLGDSAFSIRLADAIGDTARRRVRAACERLILRRPVGLVEVVPGYTTVTVHYDPCRAVSRGEGLSPFERVRREVEDALQGLDAVALPPPRTIAIGVCYGGAHGPDLEHVARHAGLTPEDVVRIHATAEYTVHLLGFVPGFAYLAGLDARIATPRRATPRAEVPAGSLAIGGSQTGVYPIRCPGGWHLIGRTAERLFLPERPVPVLLQVGDLVRFQPITPEEYQAAMEPA